MALNVISKEVVLVVFVLNKRGSKKSNKEGKKTDRQNSSGQLLHFNGAENCCQLQTGQLAN